jgi:hypothetical protein
VERVGAGELKLDDRSPTTAVSAGAFGESSAAFNTPEAATVAERSTRLLRSVGGMSADERGMREPTRRSISNQW